MIIVIVIVVVVSLISDRIKQCNSATYTLNHCCILIVGIREEVGLIKLENFLAKLNFTVCSTFCLPEAILLGQIY